MSFNMCMRRKAVFTKHLYMVFETTGYTSLTKRTMLINIKCGFIQVRQPQKKTTHQYWTKSLWSNGFGIFHSHQSSQDNLRQLNYSYTLWGLIVSVSHGGHWSKHSHCHTWLLAEQFFSVALSVLCSFSTTCHWCKLGNTHFDWVVIELSSFTQYQHLDKVPAC